MRIGNSRPRGAHPEPAWAGLHDAATALVEDHRARRGMGGFGGPADAEVVARLAPLQGDEETLAAVRDAGRYVGVNVYARRAYEDSFAGAFVLLSTMLLESGLGSLRADDVHHRTAEVSFDPSGSLAGVQDPRVIDAYLAGVQEGFLSEAFNCEVAVVPVGTHRMRARLLAGRNVNQERST